MLLTEIDYVNLSLILGYFLQTFEIFLKIMD